LLFFCTKTIFWLFAPLLFGSNIYRQQSYNFFRAGVSGNADMFSRDNAFFSVSELALGCLFASFLLFPAAYFPNIGFTVLFSSLGPLVEHKNCLYLVNVCDFRQAVFLLKCVGFVNYLKSHLTTLVRNQPSWLLITCAFKKRGILL
jgi:hypothetical protein